MENLPVEHQIGNYVCAVFPPHALLNCKVEAVKFKRGKVLYDISIKMNRPDWGTSLFTSIRSIDSAFICKQGQETKLLGEQKV